MDSILTKIGQELKTDFERTNRLLTFHEYLELLEKDQIRHTRGASQYLVDMMDYFGVEGTSKDSKEKEAAPHFKLFDMEFSDPKFKVIGQQKPQYQIYKTL